MSKAFLVLDNMPDRFGHCRLAVMQRCYPICAVTGLQCTESKPEWCPLHEMPEPMYLQGGDYMEYNEGCVDGWNNCLDELEGNNDK